MRCPVRALAVLGVAALIACEESTSPREDVMATADAFTRIGDSVTIADGSSAAVAYYGLADALRRARTFTPVTLTFDGRSEHWMALGTETVLYVAGNFSLALARPIPPPRSLLLWDPLSRRRVAQLVALGDGDVGLPQPGAQPSSLLTYSDGKGGMWVGTGGSQSSSVEIGDHCPTDSRLALPGLFSNCNLAQFQFQFQTTLDVPPFALPRNTAQGTHTMAMSKTTVAGVSISSRLMIENPLPPGLPPGTLVGRVSAAVADSVTFTYEVGNPSNVPVQLTFSDAQRFDIAVVSGTRNVWQWSADKAFAQIIGTHTWAPGETVTFTEKWLPTAAGPLIVTAWLVRTSERAGASAVFTVK
ncbi:MAG TPA: BsuPI-related putative proteinase inhibitor [Gemmatimonadaceae bacterium]|nr:BsuPI-related putative proteinase inhibitor [Gemmatimonadaceae bacterium]